MDQPLGMHHDILGSSQPEGFDPTPTPPADAAAPKDGTGEGAENLLDEMLEEAEAGAGTEPAAAGAQAYGPEAEAGQPAAEPVEAAAQEGYAQEEGHVAPEGHPEGADAAAEGAEVAVTEEAIDQGHAEGQDVAMGEGEAAIQQGGEAEVGEQIQEGEGVPLDLNHAEAAAGPVSMDPAYDENGNPVEAHHEQMEHAHEQMDGQDHLHQEQQQMEGHEHEAHAMHHEGMHEGEQMAEGHIAGHPHQAQGVVEEEGQGEVYDEEGEEYEEEGEAAEGEEGSGWMTSSQRADLILKRELPHPDPGAAVGNLEILPMLLEQIEAHILYYGRIYRKEPLEDELRQLVFAQVPSDLNGPDFQKWVQIVNAWHMKKDGIPYDNVYAGKPPPAHTVYHPHGAVPMRSPYEPTVRARRGRGGRPRGSRARGRARGLEDGRATLTFQGRSSEDGTVYRGRPRGRPRGSRGRGRGRLEGDPGYGYAYSQPHAQGQLPAQSQAEDPSRKRKFGEEGVEGEGAGEGEGEDGGASFAASMQLGASLGASAEGGDRQTQARETLEGLFPDKNAAALAASAASSAAGTASRQAAMALGMGDGLDPLAPRPRGRPRGRGRGRGGRGDGVAGKFVTAWGKDAERAVRIAEQSARSAEATVRPLDFQMGKMWEDLWAVNNCHVAADSPAGIVAAQALAAATIARAAAAAALAAYEVAVQCKSRALAVAREQEAVDVATLQAEVEAAREKAKAEEGLGEAEEPVITEAPEKYVLALGIYNEIDEYMFKQQDKLAAQQAQMEVHDDDHSPPPPAPRGNLPYSSGKELVYRAKGAALAGVGEPASAPVVSRGTGRPRGRPRGSRGRGRLWAGSEPYPYAGPGYAAEDGYAPARGRIGRPPGRGRSGRSSGRGRGRGRGRGVVYEWEVEEENDVQEDAAEEEDKDLVLPHVFDVGTNVEVASNEEGLRGSWFTGMVIETRNVEEDPDAEEEQVEALVRYDELLHDSGSSKLEEWVSTAVPTGSGAALVSGIPAVAPDGVVLRCLRPARNKTPLSEEEHRRKRRRMSASMRPWGVGDHVDAWVDDGWWESSIVAVDGEEKITVRFLHLAGQVAEAIVKPHQLRPSVVYRTADGVWVQLPFKGWAAVEQNEEDMADGFISHTQPENAVSKANALPAAHPAAVPALAEPSPVVQAAAADAAAPEEPANAAEPETDPAGQPSENGTAPVTETGAEETAAAAEGAGEGATQGDDVTMAEGGDA